MYLIYVQCTLYMYNLPYICTMYHIYVQFTLYMYNLPYLCTMYLIHVQVLFCKFHQPRPTAHAISYALVVCFHTTIVSH